VGDAVRVGVSDGSTVAVCDGTCEGVTDGFVVVVGTGVAVTREHAVITRNNPEIKTPNQIPCSFSIPLNSTYTLKKIPSISHVHKS
jgi:hypothetical protein